ncbi:MFS transporter [Haloprofundus marisrubri]|uniref:MFS transporter n=1 Tax=Haloprofundus marisrubri TaxID=1514971 RepID=A0A0W1RCP7_9EURY|nr:MFS transporter [Haloprofundus marisrubri]KTG10387.1 MFS transporter [Haloprofundus marisrubri]
MTRRLFGTLCGFVLLVNFGRTAFAPLVEPLQAAFGVGPAAIGLVTSLVWFGTAVPRIPVGYLLTRVSRHRVVLGTGVLLTAAAAFTATATTLLALQLGAFTIGIASGAYFVAAVPLVGELYPDAVGRAVGIHGTASQIAAVVAAPVVVTLLAAGDWRHVFWLLAACTALITLVLVLVVRRRGTVPSSAGEDRNFREALSHWRVIVTGIAIVGVAGFAWQGLFNFYVPYLTASKAFTQTQASTMLTVVFAAGVPAFWLSGRLADRLPHLPYVLGIVAAFGVSLVALTAVSGFVPVLVVTATLGYVIHSLFPALDTYMLGALPASARGSAYAVYSGVALFIESGGSGAVGFLTGAAIPFDSVFRLFALAVGVELVVLLMLYAAGRLPDGGRSADVAAD